MISIWCADPADLERALARRLSEMDPATDYAPVPEHDKLARLKIARELQRVIQH
jgi:hypothetical protein